MIGFPNLEQVLVCVTLLPVPRKISVQFNLCSEHYVLNYIKLVNMFIICCKTYRRISNQPIE